MKESTVYTADSTEGGEDRKDTMVTNTSARNVVPGKCCTLYIHINFKSENMEGYEKM